jgi:hypothetical protein
MMRATVGRRRPPRRETMATESTDIDVEAETDRLYQLPLDAFVEARNALASRLKAAGDKDGAARVKALARPNVPAWAVNQLHWTARDAFDALLASAERLQTAQAGGAAGASALREAMNARRQALGSLVHRAEGLLTKAGHGTNPATLRRVSNTLEALAAAGSRPEGVRPGRLVQELEPPGFDAFAGMAASLPEGPRPKTLPFAPPPPTADAKARKAPAAPDARKVEAPPEDERGRALESARAALAEAEARLERARRAAREAAGALSVAEKRAEGARGELDEATRRLERAKERTARTTEDEAAARREAERRAADRDAAEADRDEALHAVRRLE